MKGVHMTTFI